MAIYIYSKLLNVNMLVRQKNQCGVCGFVSVAQYSNMLSQNAFQLRQKRHDNKFCSPVSTSGPHL